MSEAEQIQLVHNIVQSMKPVNREIQIRQISHFYKADPDYGNRVVQGLGLEIE